MTKTISITGYTEVADCAHCNRELRHGICLDDGSTVGATCFARKLTAPRMYRGKPYRLGAEEVISLAKRAHNPAQFSLTSQHFTFEAVA